MVSKVLKNQPSVDISTYNVESQGRVIGQQASSYLINLNGRGD
jgi:hypothetical protein